MLKTIFWSLYLLDAAIHLYACYPQTKFRLRAITKCLLMPLLACCYAMSAKVFSPLVFSAILFGFLGDVFLILPERKWTFGSGLLAFAIGHVFYIIYFLSTLSVAPSVWLIVLLICCSCIAAYFMSRYLWDGIPALLRIPCIIYMLDLAFMACSAFLFAQQSGSPLGYLALIGGLFFLVSDSILASVTFKRALHYRHLLVMSTYIAAQTLLCISISLA